MRRVNSLIIQGSPVALRKFNAELVKMGYNNQTNGISGWDECLVTYHNGQVKVFDEFKRTYGNITNRHVLELPYDLARARALATQTTNMPIAPKVPKIKPIVIGKSVLSNGYEASYRNRGSVNFGCNQYSRAEVQTLRRYISMSNAEVTIRGTRITLEILDRILTQIR